MTHLVNDASSMTKDTFVAGCAAGHLRKEWGPMSLPQKAGRLVVAVAVMMVAGLLGAAPAWASPGAGWVRLAHMSPNTPPVDVYLYSFGDPRARLVLRHVSYGMVSPYQEVPAGDYT